MRSTSAAHTVMLPQTSEDAIIWVIRYLKHDDFMNALQLHTYL